MIIEFEAKGPKGVHFLDLGVKLPAELERKPYMILEHSFEEDGNLFAIAGMLVPTGTLRWKLEFADRTNSTNSTLDNGKSPC